MIENIIIISAWCWGIHCLLSEGYLLEKHGLFIEKFVGTFWIKPLWGCPPCMGSVHGIPWGLYFYGFDLKVILFVISLTGFNYVIKTFVYPEYED